jgi:hypothetical protein
MAGYNAHDHWFSDMTSKEADGAEHMEGMWKPYLQIDSGCFPLSGIWFHSEADCDEFIASIPPGVPPVPQGMTCEDA